MEQFSFFILMLDATARVSVPLVLAAMAGLFAERSGVVDISLEGKLLGGAFAAAAVGTLTGVVWLGLIAAIIASVLLALLHGYACITHNGNQVVSGVAINIMVSGMTVVAGIAMFSQGGRTPQLDASARFLPIDWPGAAAVADVPILGDLYSELFSGHNALVYIAFLMVPLTWWIVYRTRFGLRLRAVGENPEAVDTAGISVAVMRYRAMIVAGILCGIGGAYLSTAQNGFFLRDMSAGKGFIALAALIFGKWRPLPVLLACLLFGFLDAGSARLQGVLDIDSGNAVVREIMVGLPFVIDALPFILVVLLLAGFVGTAVAPKASGIPYVKER